MLGFAAARWRRAEALDNLDEWGLGGRGFGTFIAWFLIGGDIYTAYTFIAVPATLYAGSVVGFFAVPYTIVVYPLIFLFLPRLWSVSHRHSYVTPADFVQGRYDSKPLALAVAVTGILATMPYIALQLVGMQVVLEVMGIGTGSDNWFVKDLPLFIAFAVLAAYTYSSGLRAPALIAFVKDSLIYLVIIVAVHLPALAGRRLGPHLLGRAGSASTTFNTDGRRDRGRGRHRQGHDPAGRGAVGLRVAGARLGAGAVHVPALDHRRAVDEEPHRDPPQRRAAAGVLLPARAARAARLRGDRRRASRSTTPQQSVPQLFENEFPGWFAGVAFAAIVIGALVPAAIMSIAAANLWTRNIYKAFIKPDATHAAGGHAEQAGLAAGEVRGAGLRAGAVRTSSRSTCSCSAASGSCRRCRRSWSASTPGGSTGPRCSPAGRSAWPTGPGWRTASRWPATRAATSVGPLVRLPRRRTQGLHRVDRAAAQPGGGGRADASCCAR